MRAEPTTRQSVLFPDLLAKPVVARFDQTHGSSDGGAILLKAADRRLRLSERLAACLPDRRQPSKVAHEIVEMFRQRLFAIACGYPDCNDAARLADDPIHKMLVGRDPMAELALRTLVFAALVWWCELRHHQLPDLRPDRSTCFHDPARWNCHNN